MAGAIPTSPSDPSYPQEYQVIISGQDETGTPIGYNQSGRIVAALPEQFDLMTTSEWAPIFPSPGIGGVAAAFGIPGATSFGPLATAIGSGTAGYSDQLPFFSQLFWVHTSPLSFQLNLQFNAIYDAKAEVMGNLQSLVLLTLPSQKNVSGVNLLYAPGPNLIGGLIGKGNFQSKYKVNLQIGKAWLFSNVLIQDVHGTVDTMPTSPQNGSSYISANVSVRVSTNRIYTKQDMLQAFQMQPQGDPTKQIGQTLGNLAGSIKGGINQGINNAYPNGFGNSGSGSGNGYNAPIPPNGGGTIGA